MEHAPSFPAPADELTIEQRHPRLNVDEAPLRRRIRHVLEAEGRDLTALSVVLADHDTVLELNQTYLDHDYVTDVLSFPLGDPDDEGVDGEIYVDLDTAQERHAEFEASFTEEVHRYVVHGLLHLLGYDDHTPEGQQAMREREDRYLTASF